MSEQEICDVHGRKVITNSSVFPYKLSVHAAWLLLFGLRDYIEDIPRRHADGELPSYCGCLIHTAGKEVKRLLEWFEKIDTPYLGVPNAIKYLNELAQEVETLRVRFFKLEEEELAELRARNGN